MQYEVPSLDMSRLENDREAFVQDVGNAYKSFGFCVFSNHGIDPQLIERTYESFRELFALERSIKMKYWSKELSGKRGYMPFKVETALGSSNPDLKEFYHVGREGVADDSPYRRFMAPNIWPEEVPSLRDNAVALYGQMEALGQRILRSMAAAIRLPEDFFQGVVSHGNSILRGLHYPPVSSTDLPCVRAAAHEDISLITLLLGADGGGLELRTAHGQWLPVNAKKGEVVVNVGDMMQRLTNHVYVSTTHRVVNPQGEAALRSRYSIPFFLDPNPDYLIKTLPQCVDESHPDRYPEPITANDYLLQRLSEIKVAGK